ncbi:uncharacterized protein BX663DRAFT_563226 [Cokeromyces recurvatus]|uniref:uncharacterized protein n=1 Tax=Cokeromyces recurvatus TaxID=90255 RepID=UPI0022204B02|nr:uncharacterized protein BX663DRAFT_563226 [Cokeromyces recurvatus]KAI7900303.1 hypothetical protein BX663DRAFT_563226 [Cokeromyces recurvatus]
MVYSRTIITEALNKLDNKRIKVIIYSKVERSAKLFVTGDYIIDIMIESNLVESRQDVPIEGHHRLNKGQSVPNGLYQLGRYSQGIKSFL